MPIDVDWLDEEKTRLCNHYRSHITGQELGAALTEAKARATALLQAE